MKLVRAKEGYRKVGDKYLLTKKCTCCGRWLVASTDNFSKAMTGKYGLRGECKECRNKKNKQWYKANRDKIVEREKQRYQANKEKMAEYYETNREKILEYQKQYNKANKEKRAEYHKQYHEANKDKLDEYNKRYYEANKDKLLKQHRQYMQTPQGQLAQFNANGKRRQKEEAQGTGATREQWLEMMHYFDWRCAYSGERLTEKTQSKDHIVPLDAGGDHMIWNMVPMTRSLNSSKRAKDMLEWYREQSFYDPKRLAKIYDWQEYAYNKWGKDTEYFNTNDIQITLL